MTSPVVLEVGTSPLFLGIDLSSQTCSFEVLNEDGIVATTGEKPIMGSFRLG